MRVKMALLDQQQLKKEQAERIIKNKISTAGLMSDLINTDVIKLVSSN